jgi:hypothetical protein
MPTIAEQTKPLARSEGLVIQDLPDEVLVYDLERDKAHCLNQTAAIVWKHCDGKTSVSALAQILAKESGLPVDDEVVWLALEQLNKARLLPEALPISGEKRRISRRDVMKKVGLVTVVALPLVTSILAPTVAQAGPVCGQPCTPGPNACPAQCPTCSVVCI